MTVLDSFSLIILHHCPFSRVVFGALSLSLRIIGSTSRPLKLFYAYLIYLYGIAKDKQDPSRQTFFQLGFYAALLSLLMVDTKRGEKKILIKAKIILLSHWNSEIGHTYINKSANFELMHIFNHYFHATFLVSKIS